MSCNFTFCSDISCTDYCAAGVMYVSLDTFRNIFQFSTNEITNNTLPTSVLDDTNAGITYYVNSSSYPIINPIHAMMDVSLSEGIIYTSPSRTSNLIKHDFIYYLGLTLFGGAGLVAFINNKYDIKVNLEEIGWSHKNAIEQTLQTADNSGNGLDNTTTDNSNLTRRFLQQIVYHNVSRLDVSINGISDITTSQPVPFIEGDTISFFMTITPDANQHLLTGGSTPIPPRIYRIILYLTNDGANVNTVPSDSVSTTGHAYIDNDGVP